MILSVHHAQITIPTGSEDEAREFYCAFLMIPEIPKPASLAGRGGFWLEQNGFQVHVGIEDSVDRSASRAHLAYLVDNLDGWQKKLEERNIKVTTGTQIPNYRRFEFRDPFGNRVEFLETNVQSL